MSKKEINNNDSSKISSSKHLEKPRASEYDLPLVLIDNTKDPPRTFQRGNLLGTGGFAKVFLVKDESTRMSYADKVMSKAMFARRSSAKHIVERDISLHKKMKHENVITFHIFFEDSKYFHLLLELAPQKTLLHVNKYRRLVTESEVRYYTKQIMAGTSYIHSMQVLHRDLKLENMFLSSNMVVKIGDFGLATTFADNQPGRICGTPNYIAPEVLAKAGHSTSSEVWSIGCMVYAMLCGTPPFETMSVISTYQLISNCDYKIPSHLSLLSVQFIQSMLTQNPSSRGCLSDPQPTSNIINLHSHPFLVEGFTPTKLPSSALNTTPVFSDTSFSLGQGQGIPVQHEEDNDKSDSDEDLIQISDNKDNDSSVEVIETVVVSTSQYYPIPCVSADQEIMYSSVVRKCRVQLDLSNIVERKAGRSIKPGTGEKQQLQLRSVKPRVRKKQTLQQRNIKSGPGEKQKIQPRSIKPGPEVKQQLLQRCNKTVLGDKQKPQLSSKQSGPVGDEQKPGLRSIKPGPGGEQSPAVVLRTVGLTERLTGLVKNLSGRVRSGCGGRVDVRKGVNRLTRGKKRGVTEVDDLKVVGGPEESKDKVSKVEVDKKCDVGLENKTAVILKPRCIELKKIKLFSQDEVIEDRENCDQASSQDVQVEVVTRTVNGLRDLAADEDALATSEEVYPQTDYETSLELSLSSAFKNVDSFPRASGISEVKTFEDEEALHHLFNSCQVSHLVPSSAIEESYVQAETEVNKAGIESVYDGGGEVCNRSKTTKVDEQLNAEEVNCKALGLEQHCQEALTLSESVIHENFAGKETNTEVEPVDVEVGKPAEDTVELGSELTEDNFINVNEMHIPCLGSSVQSEAREYVETGTLGMIEQVDNIAIETKIVAHHRNFKFICGMCENQFSSKGNLAMHKQSVHGGKTFKCDKCEHQATQKGSLIRHQQSVHGGKTYSCELCPQVYRWRVDLTRHKQSAHEGLKFKCNKCSKEFPEKRVLSIHNQSVHEKRKFQCGSCDHQARTKAGLTVHKQSIHEDKRYPCDKCDYQATQKGDLTRHHRSVHEKYKKYICDLCEYKSCRKYQLKTHKQSVHGMT